MIENNTMHAYPLDVILPINTKGKKMSNLEELLAEIITRGNAAETVEEYADICNELNDLAGELKVLRGSLVSYPKGINVEVVSAFDYAFQDMITNVVYLQGVCEDKEDYFQACSDELEDEAYESPYSQSQFV